MQRGLNFECTSHSAYGFFLPLMAILGEILDMNHARNRPQLGPKAHQSRTWDEPTDNTTQLLELFEQSPRKFEATNGNMNESMAIHNSNGVSLATSAVKVPGTSVQTHTAAAYGTHFMHALSPHG